MTILNQSGIALTGKSGLGSVCLCILLCVWLLPCILAQDMEPLKLYNVKRACWHTHTLSEDATVLIVENRDTTANNSPEIELTSEQREQLSKLTRQIW